MTWRWLWEISLIKPLSASSLIALLAKEPFTLSLWYAERSQKHAKARCKVLFWMLLGARVKKEWRFFVQTLLASAFNSDTHDAQQEQDECKPKVPLRNDGRCDKFGRGNFLQEFVVCGFVEDDQVGNLFSGLSLGPLLLLCLSTTRRTLRLCLCGLSLLAFASFLLRWHACCLARTRRKETEGFLRLGQIFFYLIGSSWNIILSAPKPNWTRKRSVIETQQAKRTQEGDRWTVSSKQELQRNKTLGAKKVDLFWGASSSPNVTLKWHRCYDIRNSNSSKNATNLR